MSTEAIVAFGILALLACFVAWSLGSTVRALTGEMGENTEQCVKALLVRLVESDERAKETHQSLLLRLQAADTQSANALGALNQSLLAREGQIDQAIAAARLEVETAANAEIQRYKFASIEADLQRKQQDLDVPTAMPPYVPGAHHADSEGLTMPG